jgi:hypothetical protein
MLNLMANTIYDQLIYNLLLICANLSYHTQLLRKLKILLLKNKLFKQMDYSKRLIKH